MDIHVIPLVGREYTPNVLSALSDHLGENQVDLETALSAAVPSLFAALLKKDFSLGQTGLSNMIAVSESRIGSGNQISENLKNVLASIKDPNGIQLMKKFDGILENIFGDRLHSVATAISTFSRIKPSSAHRLLAGVSGVSMAVLDQVKKDHGIADKAVMDLLAAQKEEIIGSIPPGLDLAAALGVEQLSDIDKKPTIPDHDLLAADKIAPGKSGKWLILLILLILVVASWWFWKQYTGKQDNYKPKITQRAAYHIILLDIVIV